MTLLELKQSVDALLLQQPPDLETNVKEVRVLDNGDWRHVEATTSSEQDRELVERALASFERMRRQVDEMIARNREERMRGPHRGSFVEQPTLFPDLTKPSLA